MANESDPEGSDAALAHDAPTETHHSDDVAALPATPRTPLPKMAQIPLHDPVDTAETPPPPPPPLSPAPAPSAATSNEIAMPPPPGFTVPPDPAPPGSPAGAGATTTETPGAAGSDATRAAPTGFAERFADEGTIARGGFGTISRVRDRALLRTVAMKVLDERQAHDPTNVRRFVEEAQITGQLEHPNIVPVHEVGVTDQGEHYFTMKRVQGRTLTEVLAERPFANISRAGVDEVLKILVKVCDALSFAHARGVLHRDLKPDNIMVGTHGQVYLMDWGIAWLLETADESLGRVELPDGAVTGSDLPGTIIGSPAYMSPEQAMGAVAQLDARSDVFSLGAILYQFLTGEPPYDAPTSLKAIRKAQLCELPPADEAVPDLDLPPELVRITSKAMQKDPAARYATVAELRDDLETFLAAGWWFPVRDFERGALIIEEGAAADAAYIIVKGTCEAFQMERGRKIALRTMGPGDVFGETAILTGQPRTASVRAVSPMRVMVVTRDALEAENRQDSWMGAFVRTLASRFRELDKRLSAMRRAPKDHVVVTSLLETLNFQGRPSTDGRSRECPFSSVVHRVAAECGRSSEEVEQVIERHERLSVDRSRDVLVLAAPGALAGAALDEVVPGLKPAGG